MLLQFHLLRLSLVFHPAADLTIDLIYCRNSYVGNVSIFNEIQEKLRQVLFFFFNSGIHSLDINFSEFCSIAVTL